METPTNPAQLWEFECWWCHHVVEGPQLNVAPSSPCPFCGIYWSRLGPKAIQAGPPGAHPPPGILDEQWELEDLLDDPDTEY